MKRLAVLLFALTCAFQVCAGKVAPTPYTYTRVGNLADASGVQLKGGTVLMGGGADVDAAFRWMCDRSSGGDLLIIRATGTDAYNKYIQRICGTAAHSVATLIIPSAAAANDPRVRDLILHAEAIWIAGGDQSNYVNFWKGTGVQAALNQRILDGAPVGGTSAGLNVLTQFVYSALGSQGVTSSEALANPFNAYMTFDRDFATVPSLAGIIGDPHFSARDRMGRDLAFMCRVYVNKWSKRPRSISVDEQTALLVDENAVASVVGNGSVYFLQAPTGGPQVCADGSPLTYLNITVYRIEMGDSFVLGTWLGTGGIGYTVSADRGALSSSGNGGLIY
jgi:cyanophycinase